MHPRLLRCTGMLTAAFLLALLQACAGHGWDGPVTDHFDGEEFHNPGRPFDKSLGDLLRYMSSRDPGVWEFEKAPVGPPPPASVPAGALRVTAVNHATVLLQADGLNVLTDPIYSDRASPLSWAGPHRYRPPGITFADLPPIHVIAISHNHYDHMDLPTLQKLVDRDNPLILVPLGDASVVAQTGSTRIRELDWWEPVALPNGRRIWATPCQHWSGRKPMFDRNRSLWLAYVLETGGGPVYFAGDTGFSDHFQLTRDRFGPMRLSLLPIGAYAPRWLVSYQHMDIAEAVRAHRILGSQRSIGIHYGTFELSDVGQHQPLQDLARVLAESDTEATEFTAAEFGRGLNIAPLPAATKGSY